MSSIKNIITLALLAGSTLLADDTPALYPAPVGEKWGFISREGKMVIEPQYPSAAGFHEGLAAVLVGRVWGYIDATGKMVIQPQYRNAQGFSEGLAAVLVKPADDQLIGDPSGFIDSTGKMVIEAKYEKPSPFSDGIAWVVLDNRAIFIDKTGKPLPLPEKCKAAGTFREGLGAIRRGSQIGYIDNTGKIILEPRDGLGEDGFSEGLISLSTTTGEFRHREHTFAYIDKTGKTVIEPKIDFKTVGEHHEFSDGLAWLHLRSDKFAFLDKTGAIAFEVDVPRVTEVSDFHDGRALIQVGGGASGGESKYGFIDKTGKVVIQPIYNSAGEFDHGLAHVQRENLQKTSDDIGYIDVDGKVIWGFTP